MKLAVGLFVRLLNPSDALDNVLGGNGFDIHRSGVAKQTEDGGMFPVPGVDLYIVGFGQMGGKLVHLLLRDMGFEYDNHQSSDLSV